jgi:hypothetical protein
MFVASAGQLSPDARREASRDAVSFAEQVFP